MTQVAAASEGFLFHNRLTHSLKVAQVARRLAEKLASEQQEESKALGGIDPDVVEAAALAHDVGHPPFGHIAEKKLDELVRKKLDDGFEGNPQSFRIVTKLAIRQENFPGLNLTRATLNAILKYPWFRQAEGLQQRKWGAYHGEEDEFAFAREGYENDIRKSVEAELMDWADDITYSVHDVEDFYRAGLIRLDRLVTSDEEFADFVDGVFERWKRQGRIPEYPEAEYREAAPFMREIPITAPYEGTLEQRADLRSMTSGLISRYVDGIRLQVPGSNTEPRVVIEKGAKLEVAMWKELTWHYVIEAPALAAQQYGQMLAIEKLFEILHGAAVSKRWAIFPPAYREFLEGAEGSDEEITRLIADIIAGLTEPGALGLYHRLTGISPGSVLDVLFR